MPLYPDYKYDAFLHYLIIAKNQCKPLWGEDPIFLNYTEQVQKHFNSTNSLETSPQWRHSLTYAAAKFELSDDETYLLRKGKKVLREEEYADVLYQFHDQADHPGQRILRRKIAEFYSDVCNLTLDSYVNNCEICKLKKRGGNLRNRTTSKRKSAPRKEKLIIKRKSLLPGTSSSSVPSSAVTKQEHNQNESMSVQFPVVLMTEEQMQSAPQQAQPVALLTQEQVQSSLPSAQHVSSPTQEQTGQSAEHPDAGNTTEVQIQGAAPHARPPVISFEQEQIQRAKASPLLCYPLRLHPGAELVSTLKKFAECNHLKSAFILSCVGNVKTCKLLLADSQTVKLLDKNHEIVSLTGTLSGGGHLHASLSDETGQVIGGHVLGNMEVLKTAEVVIGNMPEFQYTRQIDTHTGDDELVIKSSSKDDLKIQFV